MAKQQHAIAVAEQQQLLAFFCHREQVSRGDSPNSTATAVVGLQVTLCQACFACAVAVADVGPVVSFRHVVAACVARQLGLHRQRVH